VTLASFLDDTPYELETPSGVWAPANYDHKFRGKVSVREALARSMNVPAARLAQQVGIDRVAELAMRLGVSSPLPRVPSLALGTAELSPLEVARAYATLASGGFRTVPHTFEDVTAPARTLSRRTLRSERVLDPATAYLLTSILQDVVDEGTGVRVRWMGIEGPVAGKTGTTDNEFDLWFVGITPELVAVVWLGFDEPQPVRGVSSSEGPLPIWVSFVKDSVGNSIRGAFLRPPGIVEVEIDPQSGALALAGCPDRRTEYFLPGTEPLETCPPGRGRDLESRSGKQGGGLMRWLRDRF
jgi:membrane carboxypeptidase/penicillin-binding protein